MTGAARTVVRPRDAGQKAREGRRNGPTRGFLRSGQRHEP